MNDTLDPLNTINRVDPPSFLLTRIQERIKNKDATFFSKKTSMAISCSLMVVVLLNVFAFTQITNKNETKTSLIDQFQLLPNNNLYQ